MIEGWVGVFAAFDVGGVYRGSAGITPRGRGVTIVAPVLLCGIGNIRGGKPLYSGKAIEAEK